jgi:aryl-alcohol dehydrogenase-like predicted oxidoreductase
MWAWQFQQMQNVAEKHNWTKFVSMQNHYSLCYREEEREMNAYCHATGVGLIPWAPLYRGHLARPLSSENTVRNDVAKQQGTKLDKDSLTEEDKEIVKRVQETAEKKGWKMSQVALAWCVAKKTIPIVGFSNVSRLEEGAGVRGKRLTEEEIQYLEEPYRPKKIVGHS